MAETKFVRTISDSRGDLTVIEKCLPFDIKRVYYIYNCAAVDRGGHRHRKTQQALVCVAGSCKVYWTNGEDEETVSLDHPSKLLVLRPEDWHTMSDFSRDAVLLVLASEFFDADDYIDEGYVRD